MAKTIASSRRVSAGKIPRSSERPVNCARKSSCPSRAVNARGFGVVPAVIEKGCPETWSERPPSNLPHHSRDRNAANELSTWQLMPDEWVSRSFVGCATDNEVFKSGDVQRSRRVSNPIHNHLKGSPTA